MRTQPLASSLPDFPLEGTTEKRSNPLAGKGCPDDAPASHCGHLSDLEAAWSALDRELSDLVFQIEARGQNGLTLRLARLRNRMTELVGRH